jgi:hypothetical protein
MRREASYDKLHRNLESRRHREPAGAGGARARRTGSSPSVVLLTDFFSGSTTVTVTTAEITRRAKRQRPDGRVRDTVRVGTWSSSSSCQAAIRVGHGHSGADKGCGRGSARREFRAPDSSLTASIGVVELRRGTLGRRHTAAGQSALQAKTGGTE